MISHSPPTDSDQQNSTGSLPASPGSVHSWPSPTIEAPERTTNVTSHQPSRESPLPTLSQTSDVDQLSSDEDENEHQPQEKRLRLEVGEGSQVNDTAAQTSQDPKVCRFCKAKFANVFNRERHEKRIHEKSAPPMTVEQPPTPIVFSPRVTRQKNKRLERNDNRRRPIFDFDNDPVARALRDKNMEEINAKFAERNRKAAEERRQRAEKRKKDLEEKNRLAAENERHRQEVEREKIARSEKALANLVASRKRRR